ncbi:MAG: HD domain-containing protein [Candidatus Thorarchaeota archaeon]|nr:HD domain-containing protein [Candidatus Thorarchaeota archaeon]
MKDNIERRLEEILESKTKPCSRSEWLDVVNCSEEPLYDYRLDHTRRVVKLAKMIAHTMNGDMQIVTLAAWLHDIAKPGVSNVQEHGAKSAEIAGDILESQGYDRTIIDRVKDTIRKHVGLTLEAQLYPIEAQILWEADKLDKLGIVGYIHGIINSTRMDVGKRIEDIAKFLREFFPLGKQIVESMYTPLGKHIAQERFNHMKEFSSRLDLEITVHHGEEITE